MRTDGAGTMSEETAHGVAVQALGFIAADDALLSRFVAVTGTDVGRIREAAAEPGFLAGVLEFLLGHEPDTLAFAEAIGTEPADIMRAHVALSGHSDQNPWLST